MFCFYLPPLLVRPLKPFAATLLVGLCIAIGGVLWPISAYAGTIEVGVGSCTSLVDAILAANTDAPSNGCVPDPTTPGGADTIILQPIAYSFSSGYGGGDTALPNITSAITIEGSGAIIERTGPSQFRFFYVDEDSELTLENVTLRNGYSDGIGGAIYNKGHLTLIDSQLINNTTDGSGGAIFHNPPGTLTISNSQIVSNTAEGNGGGFYSNAINQITITNSQIVSNTAEGIGGGFYSATVNGVSLTNSNIVSNTAGDAGGFYNVEGEVTLINSNIVSNTTEDTGGGFYNEEGEVTLTNSNIVSNTAEGRGGGFYSTSGGTVTLNNTNILSNTAESGGGFFNGGNSSVEIAGSYIRDNRVTDEGGGFWSSSPVVLTNAYILSNSGSRGGGFWNNGTAEISNSQILSNTAQEYGGGIWSAGTVVITHTYLLANSAGISHGAYFQWDGSSTIQQSCIANNSDTAVYHREGDPIVATENWWGAPDGPSGAAPGSGDSVSSNVDYSNFLPSALAGCEASLALSKDVSPAGDLLPGQPFTYTVIVTNTGRVNTRNLDLIDPLPAAFQLSQVISTGASITPTLGGFQIAQLAPEQVATLQFVGQVDPAITANVTLTNTATLSHSVSNGLQASRSNNVIVPVLNWSLPNHSVAEGSGSFTATVVMSPTTPYASVTVQAIITDSVDIFPDTANSTANIAAVQELLFPPNSSSQSLEITVPDDDLLAPRSVFLELQSPSGAALGNASRAIINLVEDDYQSGMAVSLIASSAQVDIGETITYTYRVTNTGNVTLTTEAAMDDRLGDVAALLGTLAPQAALETTRTYTVQPSDFPGLLVNTVTVTGTDSLGASVTMSAAVTVAVNEPPTNLPGGEQPVAPIELFLPNIEAREE